MSTEVRWRRGTTAQHASFTGALGEITVDTDKKTVVVHDGTTPGGNPVGGSTYVQAGTGAVPRTVESRLREVVSVKDFGAVGDNTTSDQAALVNAFASANTSGAVLYFPAGTFVSTANIPNFHNVKKEGPGVVRRGTDSFAVAAKATTTNRVYVGTAGADTNDGITAALPVLTEQRAFDILSTYGPTLPGSWIITFAAGVYNGGVTFPENLRSTNRITLTGPVVNTPNVPTAIFDGGNTRAFGLNFNGSNKMLISNILFRNYTTYGIVSQDLCDIYTDNVHCTNTGTGIKMQQGRLRVAGGILKDSATGIVAIGGCTFTIGAAATNLATGVVIQNMAVSGMLIQEQSNGHVDFGTFTSCVTGVELIINSRVHLNNCLIQNNTEAGVACKVASSWLNNNNTFTNNVVNWKNMSDGLELNRSSLQPAILRTGLDTTPTTHTGTTTETTLKTFSGNSAIPADSFVWNGRSVKVIVTGQFTGTTGTKTLRVKIGGNLLSGIVSVASSTGFFRFESNIIATGATAQVYNALLLDSSSSVVKADSGTRAVNMKTGAAMPITITGELNVAGESIVIHFVEVYETGG